MDDVMRHIIRDGFLATGRTVASRRALIAIGAMIVISSLALAAAAVLAVDDWKNGYIQPVLSALAVFSLLLLLNTARQLVVTIRRREYAIAEALLLAVRLEHREEWFPLYGEDLGRVRLMVDTLIISGEAGIADRLNRALVGRPHADREQLGVHLQYPEMTDG